MRNGSKKVTAVCWRRAFGTFGTSGARRNYRCSASSKCNGGRRIRWRSAWREFTRRRGRMAKYEAEKSLADYVASALSPLLIMALVGSLVFFLLKVLYIGEF